MVDVSNAGCDLAVQIMLVWACRQPHRSSQGYMLYNTLEAWYSYADQSQPSLANTIGVPHINESLDILLM